MELLKALTGVDATHVPYKGSAAAATADLLAGRVSMSFVNTSTTIPHLRSGQLRAIAVAELQRIAAAPDIPTVAESGVAGFEATSWFGMGARAGTSTDIIQRVSEVAARAVTRPETRERLGKIGIEPRPMNPERFAEFIRSETTKWGDIIRRTGAKAE
jgi:tripartite-type tricarboxylate transporter receptor subunit TctC